MRSHTKFVHRKQFLEDIYCNECNFQTKSKNTLYQHMKLVHSEQRTKYNCQMCTFQTKYKNALRNHMKYVHGGKQYHCDTCELSFKSKGALVQHKKSKHLNEKHSCILCNFQTSDAYIKTAHKICTSKSSH